MPPAQHAQFPIDPRAEVQGLALYYSSWCPYCRRVLRAAKELDIEDQLSLRDVDRHQEHDRALRAAQGRGTVPVLRIQRAEGDLWMPESRDIVAFLRARFGTP
jgi:glutathione S-transferase